MRKMVIAAALLALGMPSSGMAGEAYLEQVTAGPMTLTISPPPIVQTLPDVGGQIATLGLVPDAVSVDLHDFPIATPAASGASAVIESTGGSNRAMLSQLGSQAGSIQQTGSLNAASLVQSGAMNGASIYQTGDRAVASIRQAGQDNRALIVQR